MPKRMRTPHAKGDGDLRSQPLEPGALVGRYRISRMIEERDHTLVCEGEHQTLGYRVAIEIVRSGAREPRRARFRRAARLGAKLSHRHVLQVLDAGELEDGSAYAVTEHVDGGSLADLLRNGALCPAAAVELGVQLLAAVTTVRARGVVHSDITPESILLEHAIDGHVSAKLRGFGSVKTIHAERADTDRGADLRAVATVLRDALGDPPRELDAVLDRALANDPDERSSDAMAMATALREVAQRLGLPRGADAWTEPREEASSPDDDVSEDARSRWVPRTIGSGVAAAAAIGIWALVAADFVTSSRTAPSVPEPVATEVPVVSEPIETHAPEDRDERRPELPEQPPLDEPTMDEPTMDEPTIAALERTARDLFVRGDAAGSMAAYRRVIDDSPLRATAWRGLGLVASARGDVPAARHALERYLELAPEASDRGRIERELDGLR